MRPATSCLLRNGASGLTHTALIAERQHAELIPLVQHVDPPFRRPPWPNSSRRSVSIDFDRSITSTMASDFCSITG